MESNSKVGTWRLLHPLVAQHVELIAIDAVWGVRISIVCTSGFFVLSSLAVTIPRQVSITLVGGLTIHGDAVVADMEKLTPEP